MRESERARERERDEQRRNGGKTVFAALGNITITAQIYFGADSTK